MEKKESERKIKISVCQHLELHLSVTEEMIKDLKECDGMLNEAMKQDWLDAPQKDCKYCSWKDICIESSAGEYMPCMSTDVKNLVLQSSKK